MKNFIDMIRQEFLKTTGLMVTATLISTLSAESGTTKTKTNDATPRRPDPDAFNEPILKAITVGLNAPNPHNTQAWKFKILSASEALLYVDESKLLPATDPHARQIHIGCGAFLALFRMGAGSLGYQAVVEYFPDGTYDTASIGQKPLAKLSLTKAATTVDLLFRQVYARQTNRLPYSSDGVNDKDFKTIVGLSRPSSSKVCITTDPGKLNTMLEILYKGMEVECYDWHAYEESRQWFRVKDDIASKRDGVNLRVNGLKGPKLWIAEMSLSSYSKKVWHSKSTIHSYLKSHHHVVMSSKGLVTFTTPTNTMMDWIKCGEDYVRFQLAACEKGFYIHPLSQVLQEFSSMKPLHDRFNELMNVQQPEKIQMVARIGKADEAPFSYRKNTSQLLINSQPS